MTRAVEQELLEIAGLPWTHLQPSFRNFLLRQPVSASPIEEANAEEKVRNLREEYFIIQGPPGTGKTKLAKRKQTIFRMEHLCTLGMDQVTHEHLLFGRKKTSIYQLYVRWIPRISTHYPYMVSETSASAVTCVTPFGAI